MDSAVGVQGRNISRDISFANSDAAEGGEQEKLVELGLRLARTRICTSGTSYVGEGGVRKERRNGELALAREPQVQQRPLEAR